MMQDSARRIARVSVESKMNLDEENYVESFRPHLMDVVHAWSSVSRRSLHVHSSRNLVVEIVLITVDFFSLGSIILAYLQNDRSL